MDDFSGPARELLHRYHEQGDERARDELVALMLPLARALARRYANRGEPVEDLEQVACIGLLKAIDRFDCAREVRFATFAVPTIAGELKRHFRDRGWMLRVPRDVQELNGRLQAARERATRELGRPPSLKELAEAVGARVEAVLEALRAAGAYRTMSLDEPAGEGGTSPLEGLGRPDDGYEQAEHRATLRPGFRALEPREREILRLRYYEGLTQREIAGRVGISQMHVSRLLRRSIADLQRRVGEQAAA